LVRPSVRLTMKRSQFVLTAGAASTLPFVAPRPAVASGEFFQPIGRALVLSGGGARGSYEAGIIGALAARAGVGDGQPLPGYGAVCGTSIGALNGWFVATGQYARLKELWYGISAVDVTRLKPQFAAARDPESGILNRFASAIALSKLTKDQGALLQSKPIFDWIVENVDPTRAALMPLAWATTNLTTQRAEYFYVRPPGAPANFSQELISSFRLTLGPHTVVREATPDILHRAIFASAAIPLAFDPVVMPGPDGTPCSYCDGGVTANTPIAIAHSVSSLRHVRYDAATAARHGDAQRVLPIEDEARIHSSPRKRGRGGRRSAAPRVHRIGSGNGYFLYPSGENAAAQDGRLRRRGRHRCGIPHRLERLVRRLHSIRLDDV
jgi:predicted acylesterase/phospholipase RssA